MYKFLFDADALIKLSKAGALEAITRTGRCVTTPEVKREVIEEGKKRLYADAEITERIIEKKLLKIREPRKTISPHYSLEPGELSVLSLHQELKSWIIVSDDQTFIKELELRNIGFIVPADLVVLLYQAKNIALAEAKTYLEGLKVFIRQGDYQRALQELEEQ